MSLFPPNTPENEQNLFALIFCLTMFTMLWAVHRISRTSWLLWFPEASLQMLCGIIVTLPIISANGSTSRFDPNAFYLLLLPPIIFNTGLEINAAAFYRNFFAIMVYANIGTVINTIIVGILMYDFGTTQYSVPITQSEGYTFGALLSATDPVTTIAVFERLNVEGNLFTIIVGASTLDDAIAVIMFDLFQEYSTKGTVGAVTVLKSFGHFLAKLFGSILLGHALGIACSYFFKFHPELARRQPLFLVMIVLFVYVSYLFADVITLSGIISSFFAAMALRRYYDLCSPYDYSVLKSAINAWAYTFEAFIFFRIGLTLFNFEAKFLNDWNFIGFSILSVFIGRVAQIYPLAYLINLYNRRGGVCFAPTFSRHQQQHHHPGDEVVDTVEAAMSTATDHIPPVAGVAKYPRRGVQLSMGYQHMLLFAGLRGPIAYATARLFSDAHDHRRVVVAATNFTVAVTTFVLGALTVPALNWFKIEYGPAAHVVFDNESSNTKDEDDATSSRSQTSSVQEQSRGYSISSLVDYIVALEQRMIQRHFKDNTDKKKEDLNLGNATEKDPSSAGVSTVIGREVSLDPGKTSEALQKVGESKRELKM